MKKSCATINFQSHLVTMAVDSANPAVQYKSFENAAGKGEIARNEQFLLFPVFSTFLENIRPLSSNLKLLSADSLSLEESKICRLGKG